METDEKTSSTQTRLSTALSRELGEELRRIRHRAKMSSGSVAEALGWSLGKLSKLETGTRGTSQWEIGALVGRMGADKSARDRVLAIASDHDTGTFVRPHDDIPDTLVALTLHERTARTITGYAPLTVPSLIQTEDYARALTRDSATARMTRQNAMRHISRPDTVLYIHEAAVRTVIGSPTVMRDQLLHLAMTCETGRITARLVPMDAPFDAALAHPGTLLTFAAPTRPLVYVETDTATVFHDNPDHVARYQAKMQVLDSLALSPTESRAAFTHWADVHDLTT
jgi:hypothetical protein